MAGARRPLRQLRFGEDLHSTPLGTGSGSGAGSCHPAPPPPPPRAAAAARPLPGHAGTGSKVFPSEEQAPNRAQAQHVDAITAHFGFAPAPEEPLALEGTGAGTLADSGAALGNTPNPSILQSAGRRRGHCWAGLRLLGAGLGGLDQSVPRAGVGRKGRSQGCPASVIDHARRHPAVVVEVSPALSSFPLRRRRSPTLQLWPRPGEVRALCRGLRLFLCGMGVVAQSRSRPGRGRACCGLGCPAQGTAKIKARDLRGKKKEELLKQLEDLKVELSQLRVAKVTGGAASKLSKIRVVRKSIARVLTVINQTQKENLRKFYKGKKYKPLDLRPKKTRAMRRRLNKHEENLKTKKQQRKERLYPLRKYAVKA
ncbi:PREDICTED: uncharacterized protein LOC103084934 [Lipotes vexillifer]|uniref:Large ribosomal subunit protein uL29 n=3 Tax=Bilateria TaxID=33213 RepID=A0A340WNL9_LIPVE|nr:PREDICTED: uncharacterized protein LOC103084934 [Lipotes vexillifer]